MIKIKNKSDCSGCHACFNICPKQCISMTYDSEGFLYPVVDMSACIDCGLCEKVCHVHAQTQNKAEPKAYACYSLNEQIRAESSSGGMFSLFADNILEKGGVVFGAAFDEALKLEHIGAGAFALTALEEFEIPSTLKEMGFSAFEGADSLKSFYATVDGKKLTDHQFDHIMIKDGVLYRVIENGYELSCYPAAKTDSTFTVAEGTVRIEYCAVMLNKYLEKVILPESLRVIGNYAFYLCENLDTFVYR